MPESSSNKEQTMTGNFNINGVELPAKELISRVKDLARKNNIVLATSFEEVKQHIERVAKVAWPDGRIAS